MDQKSLGDIFLGADATFEQRWQALALNSQIWFQRWAQASNKQVISDNGLMWTHQHMAITVVDTLQINEQIDRALQWYRNQQPLEGAICWYLLPASSGDLEARLLARGFEANWQPHWMWCNLAQLPELQNHPTSFYIQIITDEPDWQIDDLPYYESEDTPVLAALHRTYPHHVYSLIASQDNQLVGRCMLHITTGELGIAGLYAMGVVPSARRQGIGSALVRVACELAQQRGCHHIMLNATPMGEPVYRRVGFQSMGYGQTWHLRAQTLAVPAPPNDLVLFLEAIGRGDIQILDNKGAHIEKQLLQQPLPNGLTLLNIAVRCQQPASVAWLVQHGAHLDLLSAWDIGWKEQLSTMLAKHPELVNVQQGEGYLTPLHIAVERNDIALARLLLTVPNDLSLKDKNFGSTALGWAQYFQRTELIALIKQHSEQQKQST